VTDVPNQQPDPADKSLGDQATGADVSRSDEERSLGDQPTAGDALSSLSDPSDNVDEAIDSDLPLIDLAARYEIEGELGQGGMGAVLLATDRQLKRQVAIKRILGPLAQSKTALQRFVTEAQSIAALNHFNIVQVHEFGRDAEGPFLVLEYVKGGSLLDKLKEGKLKTEEAVDITCQLCDALGKAHGAGIIHRDIKPANILLTEDGAPKLTDFGLARQETADHGQTQAGAVLGTIDFMPPEQRYDVTTTDARSDLWSLAATLYQMVTGSIPKVIRLDQLPANLASVIGKMLEEDPDKRYQTAEHFKTELRKGMVTVAAPVLQTNLVTGVCPSCNTENDKGRKFCQQCAQSLLAPCLDCNEEIAVWHNVCGQCGKKQDELREQIRQKLSVTIETSHTHTREHEYEKALVQLETVRGDQYAFTQDIREQAAEQIEVVSAQRDEQYQLRDQRVELANQHQQNHDYAAAVQELEKIPEPLRQSHQHVERKSGNRTESEVPVVIADQLSNAQAACDAVAALEIEIRDAVKKKTVDGLLEKTTRYLELNPKNLKVKEVQEELLQRESQVAELIAQAEQLFEQHDYEALLILLTNWPKDLDQPTRAGVLLGYATTRLARIRRLKVQIASEYHPVKKLRFIKDYLQLQPGDEQVQELHLQIGGIVKGRIKISITIASVVVAALLLGLTLNWIVSFRKARAIETLNKKWSDWEIKVILDSTDKVTPERVKEPTLVDKVLGSCTHGTDNFTINYELLDNGAGIFPCNCRQSSFCPYK